MNKDAIYLARHRYDARVEFNIAKVLYENYLIIKRLSRIPIFGKKYWMLKEQTWDLYATNKTYCMIDLDFVTEHACLSEEEADMINTLNYMTR